MSERVEAPSGWAVLMPVEVMHLWDGAGLDDAQAEDLMNRSFDQMVVEAVGDYSMVVLPNLPEMALSYIAQPNGGGVFVVEGEADEWEVSQAIDTPIDDYSQAVHLSAPNGKLVVFDLLESPSGNDPAEQSFSIGVLDVAPGDHTLLNGDFRDALSMYLVSMCPGRFTID